MGWRSGFEPGLGGVSVGACSKISIKTHTSYHIMWVRPSNIEVAALCCGRNRESRLCSRRAGQFVGAVGLVLQEMRVLSVRTRLSGIWQLYQN